MEWLGAYGAVNVQYLIKEFLNLKANQEELTKRVNELESQLHSLAVDVSGRELRKLQGEGPSG